MATKYRDLQNGVAHGEFGNQDVLGTLNRQTAFAIRDAAKCVKTGDQFSLNAPMNWPDPPLFDRRPYNHVIYETGMGNRDDYVDGLYLQASSQWDGFLHIRDKLVESYNGLPPEQLGIEAWGARGIAGRGVLLDIERHLADLGRPFDWRDRYEIRVDDLQSAIESVGVEKRSGDILLLRTGWVTGYESASHGERQAVRTDITSPGLSADDSIVEFLWDWGVSAVASDNIGLEALPIEGEALHPKLLCRIGMPIGELWWLDELAAHSANDERYESFLTSSPLRIPGGIGSPANAIAIK